MSTSDQDQSVDTPIPTADAGTAAEVRAEVGAEADAADEAKAEADVEAEAEAADEAKAEAADEAEGEAEDRRLTPRQARRLRIALSSVGMVAMAVVLGLRIASRSSVLVVGVYGLALILCGIVIELSRNGRTRLGSWLLAVGLVAAIGSDWLLIP
ncbi:hypothetical protein [Streptomyces sp. NBC_01727]|uniref:hypothetical protein n=1 Tax=Streptomyces sp. NBC_01727 TaxID=2975924 RepID=UPI002E13FF3D|nr:hypothetical protein OIE76_34175 [Streptomyces sp. NBC_01727]